MCECVNVCVGGWVCVCVCASDRDVSVCIYVYIYIYIYIHLAFVCMRLGNIFSHGYTHVQTMAVLYHLFLYENNSTNVKLCPTQRFDYTEPKSPHTSE
jgi:hypothetical protein